jgi:hypothetical protein
MPSLIGSKCEELNASQVQHIQHRDRLLAS